jgi:hypothetical protein
MSHRGVMLPPRWPEGTLMTQVTRVQQVQVPQVPWVPQVRALQTMSHRGHAFQLDLPPPVPIDPLHVDER